MDMGAAMADSALAGAAARWTAGYAALMLAMWWVMMLAMMLPSAAPMILLYATLNRSNAARGHPVVPTGLFAAGYALAWGGFAVAAAALQWGLDEVALLDATMASASVPFGGALLIGAGIYQMTPLKDACLRRCRSPLGFLAHRWRDGPAGAVHMGLEHGLFCLGCCWVLMGLLFYGGVMNLAWIAGAGGLCAGGKDGTGRGLGRSPCRRSARRLGRGDRRPLRGVTDIGRPSDEDRGHHPSRRRTRIGSVRTLSAARGQTGLRVHGGRLHSRALQPAATARGR